MGSPGGLLDEIGRNLGKEGRMDSRNGSSAAFAERLIDESPDALLALSTSGLVLSWNRGAESIFGYPASEAVGRMLDELVVP